MLRQNPESKEKKITLGKAFDIERVARGKVSLFEVAKKEDRDRRLALMVAEHSHPKIDVRVPEIASEMGLSEKIIWNAWKKYKKPAKKALSRATSSCE